MNLAKRITEAPPSIRWHVGQVATNVIYRRAFGSLGPGSVIVAPSILRGVENIHVGADCAIYPGAWLACEPGGGPLRLGDRNYLGHDVHVHATDPVEIGSDCIIAHGAFISSADHTRGEDRKGVVKTGPIRIGDRVFVGQRAIILGGVTIGDGATIGAGAVVTRDVPADGIAAGVPARLLGGRVE